MHPLIAFYSGAGTDHRGRTLSGILAFSDAELESCHDYIQWLFPLPDPSPYNPEAPTLNNEAVQAFKASQALQSRLHQALLRMLQFYGFVMRETPQGFELLTPANASALHWMTADNHNHRRISRMLVSLKMLGLEAHVSALWQGLQQLALSYPESFTPATLSHWRLAAMGLDSSM